MEKKIYRCIYPCVAYSSYSMGYIFEGEEYNLTRYYIERHSTWVDLKKIDGTDNIKMPITMLNLCFEELMPSIKIDISEVPF